VIAPPPTPEPQASTDAVEPPTDPLRDQLLEAAGRVFATNGYDGTKIMDIVKAAGLSSGAVYGRFTSKNELLLAAVVAAVEQNSIVRRFSEQPVAAMPAEAGRADEPLDDQEATQLEGSSPHDANRPPPTRSPRPAPAVGGTDLHQAVATSVLRQFTEAP